MFIKKINNTNMCYYGALSICAQKCVCMFVCEDAKFEKKLSFFIALAGLKGIYVTFYSTSIIPESNSFLYD